MRPATGLRLLIGAVLLLALAGLSAVLAARANAGAVGTVFVNSTSNTDDTICNGPPNDNAVGNCTLREAINDVNNGLADTIKFHPAVFSKAAPGVIDLETVGGNLPIITREVTIDNTGTAVVLDCDAQNDQSWGCNWGLRVDATHNGFDFKLIGGKQFTIREIASGDGIQFNGGAFSAGDVNISGVKIDVNDTETNADGGGAILITATNLNNIDITNSILLGDDDCDCDHGVHLRAVGNAAGDLFNNNVDVTDNRIYGGDGVDITFDGDLFSPNGLNGAGHTINANVNANESVTGDAGDAVTIGYCSGEAGPCDARLSTINFHVNDNGKLSSNDNSDGNGNAIRLDVEATKNDGTCIVACNDNVTVNMNVTGNQIMDADDDEAVNIDLNVCCATSDSTAAIHVDNNLDIVGNDDGVKVDALLGEGPHNTLDVTVDNNGEITGEGDKGVKVDAHAGSNVLTDTDSDQNTTRVSVSGNDDVAGDNGDGIKVEATAGKTNGPGDADRNVTEVNVNDNGNVDGDNFGINAQARAGTEAGPGDADDNTVTVNVNRNGTVDGGGAAGVKADVIAGHIEESLISNVTGDGNATHIKIDANDRIRGHSSDGVDVDSVAGGLASNGQHNSTDVAITNNGEIRGSHTNGDGVHLNSLVCCDAANTNTVDISRNRDIIGNDADGIDLDELCCSLNTVKITDNTGVIKGNDEQGIEVTACLASGDATDPTSVDFDPDPQEDLPCLDDSVTFLTITGNNISDSGKDGILVCCGAFQNPVNTGALGKSLIANNTISHNGEDGIDLDTVTGMNIVHNQIFLNGTSATDGDNGIEIDWQFAWFIWDDDDLVKVPAHFNRISENSIYDNRGLGINLIGIDTEPLSQTPGSGTEDPPFGPATADGVGCTPFANTPITSNDCIPYPKILFTGGPTVAKVSGSACANCIVEVFVADPTPADQTGPLGRQHGEGKTFLVSVHADALGAFSVNLPCGLAAGQLTATTTDKLKNTSEFASNVPFPGTPACAAATALPTDTPAPAQPTNTPVPPANTPVPPAPTATAEPAGLCGDVNSDGVANSIDASLILQKSAGLIDALPKGDASGDVNHDGVTNAVDATLILQSAAAMIAGLGC